VSPKTGCCLKIVASSKGNVCHEKKNVQGEGSKNVTLFWGLLDIEVTWKQKGTTVFAWEEVVVEKSWGRGYMGTVVTTRKEQGVLVWELT